MSSAHEPVTLGVDMVRCTGHGICAWVFPDRVSLDEWGFAHVDPTMVTERGGVRRARRAERACPRRALLVGSAPQNPASPTNRVPPVPARPTV
jgi:ferredoxin